MKSAQWKPSRILLSLMIGLTLLIQACDTKESVSNDSPVSDVEQTRDRNTEDDSDSAATEGREQSSQRRDRSEPAPKVVTKEVVVVANPLDNLPAELSSKYADSKINIRSQPTTQSRAKHVGYKGDRITLLKEAQSEGDYIWYFVQFDRSKAKGWVRGDFVSFVDDQDVDDNEQGGDVIPIDYSGEYIYQSPHSGSTLASLTFRQDGKNLNFTAIHTNPACPPEIDGAASFVPDNNSFVGSTNDGQYQLTLFPVFSNGQPTGQFEVQTFDPSSETPLTESFEACTYNGLYQS